MRSLWHSHALFHYDVRLPFGEKVLTPLGGGWKGVLADCLNWEDFQTTGKVKCQQFINPLIYSLLGHSKSINSDKPYRTIIERPRNMSRSSAVITSGAAGGVRLIKWCFKPGIRDESTSNHFADSRVKMSPLDDMPFYRNPILASARRWWSIKAHGSECKASG